MSYITYLRKLFYIYTVSKESDFEPIPFVFVIMYSLEACILCIVMKFNLLRKKVDNKIPLC